MKMPENWFRMVFRDTQQDLTENERDIARMNDELNRLCIERRELQQRLDDLNDKLRNGDDSR